MKSVIRWATRNSPAMNTLMIAALVVGTTSMMLMRRELFPEFELDVVLVSVNYPGASPEEVEEGICQKIEEVVRAVEGIKRQTAVAQEGAGFLILELDAGVNAQKVLNEVRNEVDAIPSFPILAEEPDVRELTYRVPAIRVGIIGEDSDDPLARWRLRETAEKIRDDLLQLPTVSQVDIVGVPNYQIDVEIPEACLREHGLTLQQVAQEIRRQNVELPGGTLRTRGQDILLRGKNKGEVGRDIEKLVVLEDPSGDVITVGDLGHVRDAFEDGYFVSRIDGKPGLVVTVTRTKSEDILAMAQEVRDYVTGKEFQGYTLSYWGDHSVDVEDRMRMLIRNGLSGLVLVFVVLAVFLELRLSFWVALGIPISVLGAGAVMLVTGQTLNMLSMFAFLMALGIVVDDAIVIGENIFKHREMGKKDLEAAIEGTYEVIPSVFASVGTTIIAFVPLMFVAGVMGKFFAVIPIVVIAMLVISLVEAVFILPCHLSHEDSWIFHFLRVVLFPIIGLRTAFAAMNRLTSRLLTRFVESIYVPSVTLALRFPLLFIASTVGILIISFGFIKAGLIPFIVFPELDSRTIEARLSFPDGTPGRVTDECTQRIEKALLIAEEQLGGNLVHQRTRLVGQTSRPNSMAGIGGGFSGGHLGLVRVELLSPEDRDVHSQKLIEAWRDVWQKQFADQFPGIESLAFASEKMGPGGVAIEFKLLAPQTDDGFSELEVAVESCKKKLSKYAGVIDIDDDSRPGKWEYQLRIKEDAKALGVSLADLAETVRATYYGEEVMRLQRGRHEVKLMVRYPRNERRSLDAFRDIRVRTGDGAERPLPELADIHVKRGYSEINRRSQRRSITVSADVEANANAHKIVKDLQASFMPELIKRHPGLSVIWEGEQEQTQESVDSLLFGFCVALLAMFVLLTLEFRSYLQPLIILAIIPFGFIGAVLGHMVMRLDFTLPSLFGMIALTGVVVNDSIVLVDFINHRREAGIPLRESLIDAGRRRFRPVILTSLTTVAGLMPMLMEQSFQGQILVPMATSVAFGLMVATILILVLVPVLYHLYARLLGDRTEASEVYSIDSKTSQVQTVPGNVQMEET